MYLNLDKENLIRVAKFMRNMSFASVCMYILCIGLLHRRDVYVNYKHFI